MGTPLLDGPKGLEILVLGISRGLHVGHPGSRCLTGSGHGLSWFWMSQKNSRWNVSVPGGLTGPGMGRPSSR